MRWQVKAWVTAPGDFPSRDLRTITVKGQDIQAAIRNANNQRTFRFSPAVQIVSVIRISPPVGANR